MECSFKRKVDQNACPFIVDGEIKFPVKPTMNRVFIWQDQQEEKIGSLYIPDTAKSEYGKSTGIVLAIGDGFFSQKRGCYVKTELKVGQRVVFDETTPWKMDMKAPDGKKYSVRLMCEEDVSLIIVCDDETGKCEHWDYCHK